MSVIDIAGVVLFLVGLGLVAWDIRCWLKRPVSAAEKRCDQIDQELDREWEHERRVRHEATVAALRQGKR